MTNFKYAEFDVPGTNMRGVCCIDITKNTRVKFSTVNGVEYIVHKWQLKKGHPEYAYWPVKNSFSKSSFCQAISNAPVVISNLTNA